MATYEPSRFRITTSADEVNEQVAVRPLVAVTRGCPWNSDDGVPGPPLPGFHTLGEDNGEYVWYVNGDHLRADADTDEPLDHYPPETEFAVVVAERPSIATLPPEFFFEWADRFPDEASCSDEAVLRFVQAWGPVGGEWASAAEVDYRPRGWGDFTNPDGPSGDELAARLDDGDLDAWLETLPPDERLVHELRNRDLPEDENLARAEIIRHQAEVQRARSTWTDGQLSLYHGLVVPDRGEDPRHVLPAQMTLLRGYAYDVEGIRGTLLGFAALFEAFGLLAPHHLTEDALAEPPPEELAAPFSRRGLQVHASTYEMVSEMLSAANAGARSASRLVLTNGEVTYGRGLPDTLHGTLAQLLRFAAHGTPTRRCGNETCGRLFGHQQGRAETGRSRSVGVKYCTPRCARAQASREWRRRQRDG